MVLPGDDGYLEDSRQVALVVRDPQTDKGYQLLGQVTEVGEEAVIDGYLPEEAERAGPQVERVLAIQVDEILRSSQGPHSDEP